jgi:outer membrane protein TolC
MYNLKSSKLAFSPKLYGTASAGKTGDSPENMSGNWSVGFELTAPLFEGGETWYGYSKAESAYKQTQSESINAKNKIMKNLEKSWNSLMNSADNIEVQKAALIAAQERSKIGESLYSIGTLSFDNWTIIENNLASAKKSYLDASAEALIAEAAWINSKGVTLENEK